MKVDHEGKKALNLMNTEKCEKKIPDSIHGVVVDEKTLSDMYGDVRVEPATYGGITATEEMREFLSIPAGFRTYSKMEVLNEEVRAEETSTLMRWSHMSGYKVMTCEQMRAERDRANRECSDVHDKNYKYVFPDSYILFICTYPIQLSQY